MIRAVTFVAALGMASCALAQELPVRTATAGAYFARLHGNHAMRLNPAGIAYTSLPADSLSRGAATAPWTITLVGVSASAANNAIDGRWLNGQLYGGLDLREPGSMDRFLSVFPADVWLANAAAGVHSLVLSKGNWGLALLGYEGASTWEIPADLLDVMFRGVRFNQPKDLSALGFESQRTAPLSLAYSREITGGGLRLSERRLFLGAGANLHLGMDYTRFQTDYLTILSTTDSLQIQGQTVLRSTGGSAAALSGSGLSFDFGVIAEMGGGLTFALAVKDLMGQMTWRQSRVEVTKFSLNLQADESGNIVANYRDALDAFKSAISHPDTTYTLATMTSRLPVLLTAGASYGISPQLTVDAAGRAVLRPGDIPATGPALSLGFQYSPIQQLPLFAGAGFGGAAGITWGAGFALHVRGLQWSFGFGQNGGIFQGAKGASLSTELRLVR